MSGSVPHHCLPPLLLLAGAAACSSPPGLGVEAVLARTGLAEALLAQAKDEGVPSPALVIRESGELLQLLRAGDLDLALLNDDLGADALRREGVASAQILFHGEVVLVGPKGDPAGIHAERNLANVLRGLVESEAAFFHCDACGTHARQRAMWAALPDIPPPGKSFLSVGKGEDDVLKALQHAPGYALLARPTVIGALKRSEWSFKPMWSGEALQVDSYQLLVRPAERIPEARRAKVGALAQWLAGPEAKDLIAKHGVEQVGQAFYKPGAAPVGEGVRF